MKTNTTLMIALCGGLILPGLALARDEAEAPQRRPGPPPVPPIFRVLDKDKDGKLSEEEIDALPDMLLKLDKDGDGAVTRREFLAGRPEGLDRPERPERPIRPDRPDRPGRHNRPQRPKQPERPERPDRPGQPQRPMPPLVFVLFDTDRDGTLSADEIDASADILADLDENGDGFVCLREIRKALPRPPRGPRGPGGPNDDQDDDAADPGQAE